MCCARNDFFQVFNLLLHYLWCFIENLESWICKSGKTHPACQILKLDSFVRLGSRLTLDSSSMASLDCDRGNRPAVWQCGQVLQVLPVLPVWAGCQWADRGEAATVSLSNLPLPPSRPVWRVWALGKTALTKTDEFWEKFRGGGGGCHFRSNKFYCKFLFSLRIHLIVK